MILILYIHKQLIFISDHEHKTRFKQSINICLPNYSKVYEQKSVFYIDLKLCINLNIYSFNNLFTFKKHIKLFNLDCT